MTRDKNTKKKWFLSSFKLRKTTFKRFTNKYDLFLHIFLIWLLIVNISSIFIIGEINWKTIGLFSLSLLIIRYYIYKFWKYKKESYLTVFIIFIKKIFVNIFLLIFFLYFFTFYQNELNPATLSVNYLTNWDKNVIFIEMAHIWSKDYYDKVNKILEEKNKEWYVLFYEGVELDVPKDKVIEKLGILPTEKTYNTITSLLWNNIEVQDTLTMLKKMDKAANTDVKFSDLLEKEKQLDLKSNTWIYSPKEAYKDANFKELLKKEKEEKEKQLEKEYCEKHKNECDENWKLKKKELTKEEKEKREKEEIANKLLEEEKELLNNSIKGTMIKYVLKSIFNFSIKNEELLDKAIWIIAPDKKDFFSTQVLDKRNKKLTYNIIETPEKNIIITYGWKHFKWVLNMLKQKDPNWKIIKTEEIPIFK